MGEECGRCPGLNQPKLWSTHAEAEEVECPDCIRLSVCASIIIFGVA